MNSSPSRGIPGRPRLEPGVPLGGVAAILVTLGVIAGSMIWGDSMEGAFEDRHFRAALGGFDGKPLLPPAPPQAPEAPRAPGDGFDVTVDAEEIRRSVLEALQTLDVDAIRDEALRAAEIARAEAQRQHEEARAGGHGMSEPRHGGALAANFTAPGGVRLVDLRGDIIIESTDRTGTVRLEIGDNASALRTSVVDGVLSLSGGSDTLVDVRLLVPRDAPLTLAGIVGDVVLDGRHLGPMTLELRQGDLRADMLGEASITIREAGDVSIGNVEKLSFAVFGHGALSVDRAGSLAIQVPGSADISIARVDDLKLDVQGHANISVNHVEGPVKAALLGSGDVVVGAGEAKPLQVAITGSANFDFDGTAVDPVVLVSGSGQARVARHSGTPRVSSTGSGSVVVGD